MDPLTIAAAGQLAGGLGSWLGASSQADAAKEAAAAQERMAREALDWQKNLYSTAQGQYNPYIEAGQAGIQGMQAAIEGFDQPTLNYTQKDFNLSNWQDPGYDFRLAEAQKAINASTASKGMTLGSGALKSLQQRGQDMASQEYANAYDRWLKDSNLRYGQAADQYTRDYNYGQGQINNYENLAAQGQQAIAGLGNIGSGVGSQVSNLLGTIGQGYGNAALAQGGANAAGWSNLGSGLGKIITGLGESSDYSGTQTDYNGNYRTNNSGRMGLA